jgi:phage baseplate assembly protein W
MSRTARVYSDLDLNFSKHPITKDVSLKLNENAIIGSIKNIVLTNFGERRFTPNFGSNILAMMFEPLDDITAYNIRKEIATSISNYEPRVKLDFINVVPNFDRDGFDVTVRFYLLNSVKPQTYFYKG